MYVTRKTLAEALGLSERRITQLKHEGITRKSVFHKPSYELEASVRNYVTKLRDSKRKK